MYAGKNVDQARKHAQANANFTQQTWVLFSDTSGNLQICRESQRPLEVMEVFEPLVEEAVV